MIKIIKINIKFYFKLLENFDNKILIVLEFLISWILDDRVLHKLNSPNN